MKQFRFLNYKKYNTFKRDLDDNLIPSDSIVFILDKLCIYTHGTEYVCNGSKDSVINQKSLDFNDSLGNVVFSITIDGGNLKLVDSTGNELQEEYLLKSEFDTYKQAGDTSIESVVSLIELLGDSIEAVQSALNEEKQYRLNSDLLLDNKFNDYYNKQEVDQALVLKLDANGVPTEVSAFTNDAGYLTEHQDISGKVNYTDLATVATSGDYNDLSNKPTIPTKVSDLTNDAGYLTEHQSLQQYATTGYVDDKFDDLTGIDAEGVSAIKHILEDSDTTTGILTEIANKANSSDLSTVATTGNYNDLINKPTNVSTFTNDAGYLTQHQDISGKANSADLATVATTGSYEDLSNKPSIPTVPTNISAFTNDAGYITEHQDLTLLTEAISEIREQVNGIEELDVHRFAESIANAFDIVQRLIVDKYVLKKDVYSEDIGEWSVDDTAYITIDAFAVYDQVLYTTRNIQAPYNNQMDLTNQKFTVVGNTLNLVNEYSE